RTGIFMIDASKGFEKDGPKNRLRPRDMHKIVDAFTKQLEIPGYSRMVPLSEIENTANDFNLNIPRYVDSSEPDDIQDLHAHIHGGIPNDDIDALEAYWTAFPSLRFELFRPLREGYSELAVDQRDIHVTITNSAEYQAFNSTIERLVSEWWSGHREKLADISAKTRPLDLVSALSENLLELFHPRPLVDEYAVYEQLMSYWNQTMHDDVALIMGEGWDGAAKPGRTIDDKDRKLSETPDLVLGSGRNTSKYKMDLIPPALIVARYLADERSKLDELDVRVESAARAIEEFVEENSGEDGLLADAMDEGKINKVLASARLRVAKREDPRSDEVVGLSKLVGLYDEEAAAKKHAKEAAASLNHATLARYGLLTIDTVQQLVIDDKWRASIEEQIRAEVAGLIQRLIDRIDELSERYNSTLKSLEIEMGVLSARVAEHLAAMGVKP
ncbi:MAG: SAM-dependent methyltransferase, partial [Microbacteriaceae bacterium]|nr:SAM-dependent methyltransferase [Microbacteriaceae bacterium]